MKNYKIFTRRWWKDNPKYPNGLEPDITGRKTTIGYAETDQEAREICQDWNSKNPAGRYSRKAEFENY